MRIIVVFKQKKTLLTPHPIPPNVTFQTKNHDMYQRKISPKNEAKESKTTIPQQQKKQDQKHTPVKDTEEVLEYEIGQRKLRGSFS